MTEREKLIELFGGENGFTEEDNEILADYLLEHGVIIPPVKVCQPIWTVASFSDGIIREGYITELSFDEDGLFSFWTSFGKIPMSAEFLADDIGKTVFLTREEAEKALCKGN